MAARKQIRRQLGLWVISIRLGNGERTSPKAPTCWTSFDSNLTSLDG